MYFFKFFSTEYAACSKPTSRNNHCKARHIPGHNNVTRVQVEPRSCNPNRRKNNAFTLSAALPTTALYVKSGTNLMVLYPLLSDQNTIKFAEINFKETSLDTRLFRMKTFFFCQQLDVLTFDRNYHRKCDCFYYL